MTVKITQNHDSAERFDLGKQAPTNQKSPAPSERKDTGTANSTVLPLCFTLFSQKEPYQVQITPCDITVATGKAYTTKMPSAHSSQKEFADLLVTASHQTAAL